MSEGFNKSKIRINVNKEELNKLIKKYKNIKKYQRSSLYKIKELDGTETVINSLIQEAEETDL
jgi:hypothetical protein